MTEHLFQNTAYMEYLGHGYHKRLHGLQIKVSDIEIAVDALLTLDPGKGWKKLQELASVDVTDIPKLYIYRKTILILMHIMQLYILCMKRNHWSLHPSL